MSSVPLRDKILQVPSPSRRWQANPMPHYGGGVKDANL